MKSAIPGNHKRNIEICTQKKHRCLLIIFHQMVITQQPEQYRVILKQTVRVNTIMFGHDWAWVETQYSGTAEYSHQYMLFRQGGLDINSLFDQIHSLDKSKGSFADSQKERRLELLDYELAKGVFASQKSRQHVLLQNKTFSSALL